MEPSRSTWATSLCEAASTVVARSYEPRPGCGGSSAQIRAGGRLARTAAPVGSRGELQFAWLVARIAPRAICESIRGGTVGSDGDC